MSSERYELTDVQWNQINDLYLECRTGRLPKSNRMIFNVVYGSLEVVLHGGIMAYSNPNLLL